MPYALAIVQEFASSILMGMQASVLQNYRAQQPNTSTTSVSPGFEETSLVYQLFGGTPLPHTTSFAQQTSDSRSDSHTHAHAHTTRTYTGRSRSRLVWEAIARVTARTAPRFI
jgi:hypothetical protein